MGEAETGPLATSWHSNKFINPRTDGAVLPILHLNGYKIANPTVAGADFIRPGTGKSAAWLRLRADLRGKAMTRFPMHQAMGDGRLMRAIRQNRGDPARRARDGQTSARPFWPMIVLRSPKGWTGPKQVDGLKTEGFWRSHQVPFTLDKPETSAAARRLVAPGYKPEELFDAAGGLRPENSCSGARRAAQDERPTPHAQWRRALMRPLRFARFHVIRGGRCSVPGQGRR